MQNCFLHCITNILSRRASPTSLIPQADVILPLASHNQGLNLGPFAPSCRTLLLLNSFASDNQELAVIFHAGLALVGDACITHIPKVLS